MEIDKEALDRYITGNYGEDQFKDDEESDLTEEHERQRLIDEEAEIARIDADNAEIALRRIREVGA